MQTQEDKMMTTAQMNEMNIIDFLEKFDVEMLAGLNVLLRKNKCDGSIEYELKGTSIQPLADLMRSEQVYRLVYRKWYFDISKYLDTADYLDIEFRNPVSLSFPYNVDMGKNVCRSLTHKGSIFYGQNKFINPHYRTHGEKS